MFIKTKDKNIMLSSYLETPVVCKGAHKLYCLNVNLTNIRPVICQVSLLNLPGELDPCLFKSKWDDRILYLDNIYAEY